MSTMPRSLVVTLFHLALFSACSTESPESPHGASIDAIDPSLSLVVESKVGDALSREIAVSGRDRLGVPDTRNWSCGTPLRGLAISNVAWLELTNPSTDTVSVKLELDGLDNTHPQMFVYASKSAPVRDCLTFSGQRKLAGTSSVVVGPSSYAAILLATGNATGVFEVVIETEHVIPP